METTTPAATTVLSRTTLLLMATACGLCAGANYFNQPLLNSMVRHLQISDAQASSTVTMAQVSYGLGLLIAGMLSADCQPSKMVLPADNDAEFVEVLRNQERLNSLLECSLKPYYKPIVELACR